MIQVLIVDDHDDIADCYEHVCKEILGDVNVMFACSLGQAMLNLCKRYDLIICDRLLGDGTGERFVTQYHDKWPETHIIFYSGDAESVGNRYGIKCCPSKEVYLKIVEYKKIIDAKKENSPDITIESATMKGEDVKTLIPLIGVGITLLAGAVGYGKLANTTDTTKQELAIHQTNQEKHDADLSKALTDFAVATAELRTEVKTLRATVDKLQDKVR